MRQTLLPLVDLVQEAENTPRLAGDPMIRPAQILVVPNLPNQVPLGGGHRVNVPCVASFYQTQENKREQGPHPGAGAGDTHIFQWGDL